MLPPAESRFQTARALEHVPHEKLHERNAVRFPSAGFVVGTLTNKKTGAKQRILRFAVHEGKAVEIALLRDDFDFWTTPGGVHLLRDFDFGDLRPHYFFDWPRRNHPGLDVLGLQYDKNGLAVRSGISVDIDLEEALLNVAAKRFRVLPGASDAAKARALKLERLGWRPVSGPRVGDLTEAALAPIVKWLDRKVGTELAGCGGCARRKSALNRLSTRAAHLLQD